MKRDGGEVVVHVRGGLLGHWAFWTKTSVEMLERIHRAVGGGPYDPALVALDSKVTDANGAIFDAPNDLKGCIPGTYEVLRRQGLLEGNWCLDADEVMSPGQSAEIDRVLAAYPELADDAFVKDNLERWL